MIELIHEGITYNIPSRLKELTAGQYIEWQETHGNILAADFHFIKANSPELLRQLDLDENQDLEAESWFSFFTGLDISGLIKEEKIHSGMIHLHYQLAKQDMKVDRNLTRFLPGKLQWKDSEWSLQDSQINENNNAHKARYLVGAIEKLGNGQWVGLLPICAMYFRKEDEPFNAEYANPEHPRYELMKELPLDYAMMSAEIIAAIVYDVVSKTDVSFIQDAILNIKPVHPPVDGSQNN